MGVAVLDLVTGFMLAEVLLRDMGQFLMDNSWILFAIILWVLPWKGLALWKAAQRNDQRWFIALLLVNTLGILEILYIFVFSKRNGAHPLKK